MTLRGAEAKVVVSSRSCRRLMHGPIWYFRLAVCRTRKLSGPRSARKVPQKPHAWILDHTLYLREAINVMHWPFASASGTPNVGRGTAQVAVPEDVAVRWAVGLQSLDFLDIVKGVHRGSVHNLPWYGLLQSMHHV